uniref:Zinc-finger domain-containing protein n=1 Tax=candidate division WOR-3 bacterium TaxID=2052148 RepID=A0A7C6AGE5_UNCW3
MKNCKNKKRILDYIENLMLQEEKVSFEKHLNECEECRQELSGYRKLYELIDKDEISLPEKEFFERIKKNIRKEEIPLKKPLWKFLGVLAPVFGLVIFLILFKFKKEQSIEIPVSVTNLIQDENLNSLLLEKIVDDELIKQFNVIEENLGIESEQTLSEMNQDEKEEFIKILYNKYGEQYL